MTQTERPLLSNGITHRDPHPAGLAPEDHPALHAWAAHVAAGRIGTRAPMPPEALARIARMEAILRPTRRGAAK
ncbi:hypothetical protein [Sphingomonas bacterium]|uniref:hypothetical protein n=1 Tax=Sphingomonas bacterium TaxID=1895847 RepID=UPI001577105E|nr:hypothetical protein [Sphingomonas bacterium]